jgi:hypothetical protein
MKGNNRDEYMNNSKTIPQDTKKIFREKGMCSHTFFYILNREFGYPKENEERASDPFAGGLMKGHQCGMLWGSALAAGAESFRRHTDRGQAVASAITTTQSIMESFSKRTKCVNCRDVHGCDFSKRTGLAKYMLKIFFGGLENNICFNLAEQWAPEAIQSAREGLSQHQTGLPQLPISCASEVAKKMGASDEEMVTVAGFAGGMGLSGNACGALGAAIWMNTLTWCKKHPGKNPPFFHNPNTKKTLKAFKDATGSEFSCHKICGQRFMTIGEHTEFIKTGGCDTLMNVLAQSS